MTIMIKIIFFKKRKIEAKGGGGMTGSYLHFRKIILVSSLVERQEKGKDGGKRKACEEAATTASVRDDGDWYWANNRGNASGQIQEIFEKWTFSWEK